MYIFRIIASKTPALGRSPWQVVTSIRPAASTVRAWRLPTTHTRLILVSYSNISVEGSLRLCESLRDCFYIILAPLQISTQNLLPGLSSLFALGIAKYTSPITEYIQVVPERCFFVNLFFTVFTLSHFVLLLL